MPAFLQEREVFAAFLILVVGLVLLLTGEFGGKPNLTEHGSDLLIGSVIALGITRGLAKSGGPK